VLAFEKAIARITPDDRKYAFEARGATTQRAYSKSYATDYNDKLAGMVAARLRQSAYHLGCLWYTAWVNAGQPPMDSLDVPLELLPEEYQLLFTPTGLGGHTCGEE
jgi:hypothetical protein